MGISIMVVQYALTVLEMDRNHHAQLCLGNNLFLGFAEVLFVGRQVYKTANLKIIISSHVSRSGHWYRGQHV